MASPLTPAFAVTASTASAAKPGLLSIRNVAKTFGRNVVLRDVSLEIAEGEFLTILGESGSGKTTLLRIIAGFETATSGEVWMGTRAAGSAASLPAPRQHSLSDPTLCFRTLRSRKTWPTVCAWRSGQTPRSRSESRRRWTK